MIEYGFMDRKSDGSMYWIKKATECEKPDLTKLDAGKTYSKSNGIVEGEGNMERRNELKLQYKEINSEKRLLFLKYLRFLKKKRVGGLI